MPDAKLPCLELDDAVEEALAEDPGLSADFSAFRSIVTGRFEPVELADGDPDLSEALEPRPPVGDDPPEDLLSVAICFPPEPERFQDFHYTHLSQERYRCIKDIFALQYTTPPVPVNNPLMPAARVHLLEVHQGFVSGPCPQKAPPPALKLHKQACWRKYGEGWTFLEGQQGFQLCVSKK